jgi:hypothetical protein
MNKLKIYFKCLILLLFCIIGTDKLLAQAPGGVSAGLISWYRADNSSNTATSWVNQTGANNAVATGTPTLNVSGADMVNFNPSYSFIDGRYFTLPAALNIGGNGQAYTFIGTAKLRGTDDQRVFGNSTNNSLFGYYNNLENALYITGVPSFIGASVPNNVVVATNNVITHALTRSSAEAVALRNNGFQTSSNATSDDVVWRMNINGYSNGAETSDCIVPEFISYNVQLNAANLQKVESYLAIKYGWTLSQSSAQNYVNSDGNAVWTASLNATYNGNIAGIGRDDISLLNQKQSKSVNAGFQPVIGLSNLYATNASNTNSFTADKSFLVWGSDNGSAAFDITIINNSINTLMARKWRAQESGTVGNVKVGILASEVVGVNNLHLLVSNDATFDNSDTFIEMSTETIGGVSYYTAMVNFTDGQYFSFGGDVPTKPRVSLGETSTYSIPGTYTYTIPACVNSIVVECWGAGGGGGGNSTTQYGAGGGGGGAYSKSTLTVTPGATFTVTVGAGGLGGSSVGYHHGYDGADSYFTGSTSLVLAKGGAGGTGPNAASGIGGIGGAASAGIGDVRYSGGNGGNGLLQHTTNAAYRDVNFPMGGGGGASAGYDKRGRAGSTPYASSWAYGTPGGAASAGGVRGGQGSFYANNCDYRGIAEDGLPGGSGGGGGSRSGGTSGEYGEVTNGNGGIGGEGKVVISTGPFQIFSNVGNNTWSVPAGITRVVVSAWGGGGGGGGNDRDTGGGGGGGGGAYSESEVAVSGGQTYSVTVGSGGTGGGKANNAAGDGALGGDSWFRNSASVFVLAKGGSGGTRNATTRTGGTGASSASGTGMFRFSGGNGGNGIADNWGFGGGGGAVACDKGNGGN